MDIMDKTSDEHGAIQSGTYCFEDTLGFLLGRLKGRMSAVLDEELTELDITHAQWVILMRIANGVGRTCGELCRNFAYDTGSMTRMLDRLEAKGLLTRKRSETDRRVVELALTELGRKTTTHIPHHLARVYNAHLSGFTAEEFDVFKDFLRRVASNGTGGGTVQPAAAASLNGAPLQR